MKTKITLFTFLLTVSTCFGQWTQVGADMDGVDTGDGMFTDGDYSGHSVITSAEPGEKWAYCYVDELYMKYV